MDFTVLASSVIKPAFLSLIEPFFYAYFAAGDISVGFTPTSTAHATCWALAAREISTKERIISDFAAS
jgi:hypothetical protein